MNGYGGTILRVNLTEGKFTREPTPCSNGVISSVGEDLGFIYCIKKSQGADHWSTQ
jgi:aldehyde:ferredoxin oxidoreductase